VDAMHAHNRNEPDVPGASGGPAFTRRSFLAGAASVPLSLLLANRLPALAGAAAPAVSGTQAACALPKEVLTRIERGYRADRCGQIMVVPRGFNYVSGGISHSTPWGYTQDVPMLWYGPGVIRAQGKVSRVVTSADIAPTVAKLAGFTDFKAPDGTVMDEAIVPGAQPTLVVVLVWDAGGRYVLDLWPRMWPNLKGLIPKGTWYENATVGSNPSNTAPIHATIGTGAFPKTHGVVDNIIRFSDGKLADPWSRGPGAMLVDTLAEQYQAAMGNKAEVGMCGTLNWHLGMLGHGTQNGGPRTLAVLKDKSEDSATSHHRWGMPQDLADFYRFPGYVNDLPPLLHYFDVADRSDGKMDGRWRGHDIAAQQGGFHTPARIPFQTAAIQKVVATEGFGHHAQPDLLFLNYKIIDEIGHLYSASSGEMHDTVGVQDAYLASFIAFLNKQVGAGKWALLVTADHGHTADPSVSGGTAIHESSLHSGLVSHFDNDGDGVTAFPKLRPIWLNVDQDELRANGHTLENASDYVNGYKQGGQKVFEAAFASSILGHLPCA
jgi:hypothetical protein